jgi:hypothetical protein
MFFEWIHVSGKQVINVSVQHILVSYLMRLLMSEGKRQRIIAIRQQWPQLPGSAIAVIAGAAPSYVSEVIKETNL